MTNLFQTGTFRLHSGLPSMFKVDCDVLTDEDIKTVALMLVHRLPAFGSVIGIPQGGLRLAEAMRKFIVPGSLITLIVDDVFTSGMSMEEYRRKHLDDSYDIIGAVIFARSEFPCPDWITPLFRMER